MKKIEKDAHKVVEYIKKVTGDSPDVVFRELEISATKHVYLIYSQSVSESDKINEFVMKSISLDIKVDKKFTFQDIFKNFKNTIPNVSLKTIDNYDDFFLCLYSGFCIIILDGHDEFLVVDTKLNIDRGIQEANVEPVLKGPKDSFTENFYKNVGLIRKRIKSESLWLEEVTAGKQTKTKIGMLYMESIAEKKLVDNIRKKLEKINVEGIIDIGQLKEFIYRETKTSFPIVLRTERPDIAVQNLLQGKIVIIVENSPVIILLPIFFIDFFHTADDYYYKPIHVLITRMIRGLCFILGILTPGYLVALIAYNREIIPTPLLFSIIGQRSGVPFPAFFEAFLMVLAFEILKEGDARLPTNIGGALSVLGAIVLGQAAVMAGVVSSIMVIVVALTSMASLVFQSAEMVQTIRLWRFIFLFFGGTFGVMGIMICTLLFVSKLCSIKSFGKPYTFPFAPFNFEAQKNAIVRSPLDKLYKQNKIMGTEILIKQKGV